MKKGIKMAAAIAVAVLTTITAKAQDKIKTETTETVCAAFSDDSKLIAYGGYKKAFIMDAATKKTVKVLEGATDSVNDIAFVGDRVIGTGYGFVAIWDATTGKTVKRIKSEESCGKLSVCRKTNIVFAGNQCIEGWNINTGESVMKTDKLKNKLESFAVTPDGKLLYASPEWGQSVMVFDAETGKLKTELKTIKRCRQMIFHPNGKSLFIWMFGTKVRQVDLKGKEMKEIDSETVLGRITISNNGEYVFLPTWSTQRKIEQVQIYDTKKKKMLKPVDVSEKAIYQALLSPDEKTLLVAPKDQLLYFFPFKK